MSNCASFARAVIYGKIGADTCPLFQLPEYQPMKHELETVCKQARHPRSKLAPPMPEGGILLTKPCRDTNERVMAELRVFNGVPTGQPILYGVFDPMILCKCLNCLESKFELVKCSKELGYGRADTGDMSITLLQDGRINMRRVLDKDHVLDLFSKIEKAIFGSVICNSCGRDVLSILLDARTLDGENEHEAISGGSTFDLQRSIIGTPLKRSDVDSIHNSELIKSAIDDAIVVFRRALDNIMNKSPVDDGLFNKLEKAICSIVSELFVNDSDYDTTVLLKTMALLLLIEDAIYGINEISLSIDMLKEDEQVWLVNASESVRKNFTIQAPDIANSKKYIAYANLTRVSNALRFISIWNG